MATTKVMLGSQVLLDVSSASIIPYDNTASGLTATNVQDAIDEVNAKGASDIGYDNTISGLTAEDIQAAIDELVARVSALEDVSGYPHDPEE